MEYCNCTKVGCICNEHWLRHENCCTYNDNSDINAAKNIIKEVTSSKTKSERIKIGLYELLENNSKHYLEEHNKHTCQLNLLPCKKCEEDFNLNLKQIEKLATPSINKWQEQWNNFCLMAKEKVPIEFQKYIDLKNCPNYINNIENFNKYSYFDFRIDKLPYIRFYPNGVKFEAGINYPQQLYVRKYDVVHCGPTRAEYVCNEVFDYYKCLHFNNFQDAIAKALLLFKEEEKWVKERDRNRTGCIKSCVTGDTNVMTDKGMKKVSDLTSDNKEKCKHNWLYSFIDKNMAHYICEYCPITRIYNTFTGSFSLSEAINEHYHPSYVNNFFINSFNQISQSAYDSAIEKGFDYGTEINDSEKILLMHSELSEAAEALREDNPPDKHLPEFNTVTVEMADCIIRIMNYCKAKNFNLAEAIIKKMDYNKNRPYKHGKKF